MEALESLPPGAVTGIGSLPHVARPHALDFVARAAPSVPFWPQLPRMSPEEGLVAQMLGGLEGLLEPRPDRPYGYRPASGVSLDAVVGALADGEARLAGGAAESFAAFDEAAGAGRFERARALKAQVTGPETLAMHLFPPGTRGASFARHPALLQAATDYVARMAVRQVEALRRHGVPVILFVDEPVLGLARASPARCGTGVEAVRQVVSAIRAAGAAAGIHCCGDEAPALVGAVDADVWSFDAHQGLGAFCRAEAPRRFLGGPGRVAWGLVPTSTGLNGVSVESLFTRWLQGASMMGDLAAIAQKSLVTATCGLGLLERCDASISFAYANRISDLMRFVASGEGPRAEPPSVRSRAESGWPSR